MKTAIKYDWKKDYYGLCHDCLYYGYKWPFIASNYPEWLERYGESECKAIYKKAFAKICRE